MEKLLTVEEAAEYLDVSVSAVYRWSETGIIIGKKYGGKCLRFAKADLDNPQPLLAPARKENANGSLQGQAHRKLVLQV